MRFLLKFTNGRDFLCSYLYCSVIKESGLHYFYFKMYLSECSHKFTCLHWSGARLPFVYPRPPHLSNVNKNEELFALF